MKKEAVSIIGGADGPTSIFLAGKSSGQRTLGERVRGFLYRSRRRRVEKQICANPHTLEEMLAYAYSRYHMKEIPKTQRSYREQYASAREGLILKHRPELYGDLAEPARCEALTEESARELFRRMKLRSERAVEISDSEFPMDFHLYEIQIGDGRIELEMDFRWGIFGVSMSGSRRTMKRLKKVARELYLYYGVSEDDIKNKTKRYASLVTELSSW